MFNELFSKLTEGQGSTAKEIINSSEWNKFDFKVDKRDFCGEKGCTQKTTSDAVTDHAKASGDATKAS